MLYEVHRFASAPLLIMIILSPNVTNSFTLQYAYNNIPKNFNIFELRFILHYI